MIAALLSSRCSTFTNEYSEHADKLLAIFLSKNVECIPIPRYKGAGNDCYRSVCCFVSNCICVPNQTGRRLIRSCDERIESLFVTLSDAEPFKSFLGMRSCMGLRMLTALGGNHRCFNSAEEIQYYVGSALASNQVNR